MIGKLLPAVKYFFGWPLSILAIGFIINRYGHDFPYFIDRLLHANLSLLLFAVVSFLVYFVLRSLLWQQILSYKGHHFPFRDITYLWVDAEIKRYVPGGVVGFASRAMHFEKKNVSRRDIISAISIEIQLLILATMLLSFLGMPYTNPWQWEKVLGLVIALGILTWIFSTHVVEKLFSGKMKSILTSVLPSLPWHQHMALLFMAVITFFFFGLGTYFSIAAIASLPLQEWVSLVGLFSFAFLVGYIAVIAPSGLGVREGVMVSGLSMFIGNAAGLVALFSRFLLTLVELVYLFFVYLWQKYKFEHIETFVYKNRYLLVVFSFIVLYTTYFSLATFTRHDMFYSGKFDLGNMDQVVWNTAHGKFFQFTNPDSTNTMSRLGVHADFILVLIAPFYWIASTAKTLLFLQSLVLACGAFFVYRIGKQLLHSEWTSILLAVVYLLNPSVQWTNLYDFHAVTFATTFLLGAYYFLLDRKKLLFFLFLILAALTKEQIWVIAGLLSLYAAFVTPWKKSSIAFALFSFGMFYYLVWIAIPQARGGEHFALAFYAQFGDSPSAVVKNTVFSPISLIQIFLQEDRVEYLKRLFLPVGFFPFAAPLVLIFAGPDLLINLLSSNVQFRQLYYQYTAAITPFLFIATIYGIHLLKKYCSQIPLVVWQLVLVVSVLYSAYQFGPLPGSKSPNIDMFTKQLPYAAYVKETIQSIPTTAKVAATNNIGSHLTHRESIYTLTTGIDQADYLVFLLTDKYSSPPPEELQRVATTLRQSGEYVVFAEKEKFLVLKKKTSL